jgi:chromosome segregation ATPase
MGMNLPSESPSKKAKLEDSDLKKAYLERGKLIMTQDKMIDELHDNLAMYKECVKVKEEMLKEIEDYKKEVNDISMNAKAMVKNAEFLSDTYKSKLDVAEARNEQQAKTIHSLRIRLGNAKNDRQMKQDALFAALRENNKLRYDLESEKTSFKALSKIINDDQTENEDLREKIEELKDELKSAKDIETKLYTAHSHMLHEKIELKAENKKLREQIEKLEHEKVGRAQEGEGNPASEELHNDREANQETQETERA